MCDGRSVCLPRNEIVKKTQILLTIDEEEEEEEDVFVLSKICLNCRFVEPHMYCEVHLNGFKEKLVRWPRA